MSFSFASWIFSHEWFQVIYLGQEHPRSDIVSFKRSLILISLITHDVNFDHMVKVLSARILHYKDRFSPFIIKMYLWNFVNIPLLIKFWPTGVIIY